MGLVTFLLIAASPASASATTDMLCRADEAAAPASYPTDEALLRAAAAAEQRLASERAQGGRLDGAAAALEVPAQASTSPGSEALARYCTAAGEVMRLSVDGSQLQAQNYLLKALRESRSGGLAQLTSQAAYRLGLVSLQGPPVGGARSGGTAVRRSGSAVAGQLRSAQASEGGAGAEVCSTLAETSLDSSSNAFLSALALDCAARLALDSGDPALSALASLRLARFGLAWSESASDPEELRRLAVTAAVGALPVAARVPDPAMRAELLGRLAGTVIDLGGGRDPALLSALEALRRTEGGGPGAAAMAAMLGARLALERGETAQARALIETAILHESQRALPMRLPDYYLLLAQADPAQRERHVYAAYNALDNMRPLLPRNDPLTEESVFSLHMRRVFESAVEVQLAAADGGDAAPRIRMAQQIVEAYRQAELLNAVGSECLPPRNPVRPEDLGPREVLLYPLLLQDRLELLYVVGSERGGSEFRRLPPNRNVDRRQVTRLVEDLVLAMSVGEEGWQEPARRLYQLIIAPIEGELEPGATLAIIPDGALRALPFAALIGEDGRFLVQRTAISVAPALAYSQPGQTDNDGELSVVAASLQREVELPAGYFAALQGTEGEARIAAENGAPGVLIEDFRRQDLVSALSEQPVDVLHLATHASFNGRSDRAFIVANGEAIRLSELRDMIARNRARGDPLDLLVLSACETAVGDDEASMGLAGAAVQAGALSAIASLWQVNDLGTAELMRQFYSRYRTGRSRSDSLRDAQLALIEGGGDNARPNIWAAFTLVGAWR